VYPEKPYPEKPPYGKHVKDGMVRMDPEYDKRAGKDKKGCCCFPLNQWRAVNDGAECVEPFEYYTAQVIDYCGCICGHPQAKAGRRA